MANPKRHHWWPLVQSKLWTNADGQIYVTRATGATFRTNPINIGVESELYTRFGEDDSKDTGIEEWFADAIDGPARAMFEYLVDTKNMRRRTFDNANPTKAQTVKQLGFRVNSYVDSVELPAEIRIAIARYLAALLVRHPAYLAKLIKFQKESSNEAGSRRNQSLDNMLQLNELYAKKIQGSILMLSRRVGTAEYIYADGGLVVEEPWRDGIPFDVHAPLTPDLAIEVLPIPGASQSDLDHADIMEASNQGVARQNRIILGGAKRFVFSRQTPPTNFIVSNFGKPAPKNIGFRMQNGHFETKYDPSRI